MKKIKKAVFPVAGLGTRFLPATKASPKEMLPVVDKPLIQYAAEEAVDAGIKQLIFVIGRTKNAIIDHFDSSPELERELIDKKKNNLLNSVKSIVPNNVDCVFVRQNIPAGLGHAVHCARHIVNDEPFAVILADDLIKSKKSCLKQMTDIYSREQSPLIAIQKINKKDSDKYGIIEYGDKHNNLYDIKSIIEKPKPAKAKSNLGVVGRYVLPPSIFNNIASSKPGVGKEIQLTDAIEKLILEQRVLGYEFEGTRFDCGSKIGYLQATTEYALEHSEVRKEYKSYLKKLKI
ncbi:MAG: UTP--glucose-1-phosphate uridylyltransferase [Gammaproteobacteria bacterium]|nr:UTP--glucose-1-phosphate uridylyltransferase [Gammaproteobacteria bacterium]|tara:strand:- start:574 stop:1443 length:870 start_codon:yes stop_codon:yes gene_type:complete